MSTIVLTSSKTCRRDAQLFPSTHPVPVNEFMYFGDWFPCVRFKANYESFQKLDEYETFTCLAPGERYRKGDSKIHRDKAGRIIWSWKKNTSPLDASKWDELMKAGKVKPDESWMQVRDVETKEPVRLALASVQFNTFRKRWIAIGGQLGGKPSFLGEIWYSEAEKPEGPWKWARKIVTHDRYSFYNPVMHPFFEQEGGRLISFEGTYTANFSRSATRRLATNTTRLCTAWTSPIRGSSYHDLFVARATSPWGYWAEKPRGW